MKIMKTARDAALSVVTVFIMGMPTGFGQTIISGELVEYSTPVGSVDVQSARLRPFHATWGRVRLENSQEADNYGEWYDSGTIEEKLERDKNGGWIHTQVARTPDGEIQTHLRWLDGVTLQPLRVSVTSVGGTGSYASLNVALKTGGYEGEMIMRDGTVVKVTHGTPVPVFSAWISGVAIKSLPLEIGYQASLPTASIHRTVNYKLRLEVTGDDSITLSDGRVVEYWIVETSWLDLNDGSIFQQGETGTGGVFHVAKDGDESIPLVLNYINARTRITFQ